MKSDWTVIGITGAIIVWLASTLLPASGASVTIAWDYPYTNHTAVGFRAHYGNASRTYTESSDAPGPDTRTIMVDDLDPAKTYYFALTAYNTYSNESEYSAELVWDNIAPTITAPDSIAVKLQAGAPMVLPDYLSLVSATDDFSPPEHITITQTPAAGVPLTAGMTLTFAATDEAGNTGRVDRVVGVTIELTRPVQDVSGVASDGKRLQVNGGAK